MNIKKHEYPEAVKFTSNGYFEITAPDLLAEVSGAGNHYEPELCGFGCTCNANKVAHCQGTGAPD